MKQRWKGGNLIYPLPALMVSCGNELDGYNIITVSWGGTVCTNPPMCSISIRPERHSYDIIKKSGEFVVNLSTAKLA
ncbi:MAG: flavin reductase, partial [Bacteroidales bacterium]|nr:flavin reductase [Bacteroidales bacterium]